MEVSQGVTERKRILYGRILQYRVFTCWLDLHLGASGGSVSSFALRIQPSFGCHANGGSSLREDSHRRVPGGDVHCKVLSLSVKIGRRGGGGGGGKGIGDLPLMLLRDFSESSANDREVSFSRNLDSRSLWNDIEDISAID
jgi:hypothetical protein